MKKSKSKTPMISKEDFQNQTIVPKKLPWKDDVKYKYYSKKLKIWNLVEKAINLLFRYRELSSEIWVSSKFIKRYLQTTQYRYSAVIQRTRECVREVYHMELVNKRGFGYQIVERESLKNIGEGYKNLERARSHFNSFCKRYESCKEDLVFANPEVAEVWEEFNKISKRLDPHFKKAKLLAKEAVDSLPLENISLKTPADDLEEELKNISTQLTKKEKK